jgi:LETM1 and EF-hand domain-containing protein 1
MLEKEGTEGEEEAKKAYFAAREEPDHDAEVAAEEKVSSALIEKVRNLNACYSYSQKNVVCF